MVVWRFSSVSNNPCLFDFFAGETFKVDLNVEATEPSGDEDDDDGIDWEEG